MKSDLMEKVSLVIHNAMDGAFQLGREYPADSEPGVGSDGASPSQAEATA